MIHAPIYRHLLLFSAWCEPIIWCFMVTYWGFVLMAVHLGLHRDMMINMAGKLFHKTLVKNAGVRKWAGRIPALTIAGYGVYAFGKRNIGVYILLLSHFVFFNYDELLMFFFLDYMAVMGLFVFLGYYACTGIRAIGKRRKRP